MQTIANQRVRSETLARSAACLFSCAPSVPAILPLYPLASRLAAASCLFDLRLRLHSVSVLLLAPALRALTSNVLRLSAGRSCYLHAASASHIPRRGPPSTRSVADLV